MFDVYFIYNYMHVCVFNGEKNENLKKNGDLLISTYGAYLRKITD